MTDEEPKTAADDSLANAVEASADPIEPAPGEQPAEVAAEGEPAPTRKRLTRPRRSRPPPAKWSYLASDLGPDRGRVQP